LVAVTGWDHGTARRPGLHGPDVRLFRDRATLVIEEHPRPGYGARGVEIRVPLSSCVSASVADEPGLPGTALVRLVLVIRLGRQATFPVPLWFPPRSRRFLQQLADDVTRVTPAPTPRPAPKAVLAPLAVTRAPDDDDWIAFKAADEGEAVLSRHAGHENEVGDGR
jgi:hypothetical protein